MDELKTVRIYGNDAAELVRTPAPVFVRVVEASPMGCLFELAYSDRAQLEEFVRDNWGEEELEHLVETGAL